MEEFLIIRDKINLIISEDKMYAVDYAYCTYTYGINHNRILNEIKKLQIIVTRLSKSQNGKYEVYPWSLSKEKLEEAVNQEYREISRLYLTTTKNEYEIIKERENALIKEYEKAKSLFMQSDIEPYYGTPKFIQKRSQYILKCMEEILAA